jgi:hypothetical protein
MAWTTPKTDWKPTDYFNFGDYNRIVGNVLHIQELSKKTVGNLNFKKMTQNKKMLDMIYAKEFNAIEENVEILGKHYNLDDSEVRFSDNGAFVTYIELNRLESLIEKINIAIKSQLSLLCTLPFTLGSKTIGNKVSNDSDLNESNNFAIDDVVHTGDRWDEIPFVDGANNVVQEGLWYVCEGHIPMTRYCIQSGVATDFNDFTYFMGDAGYI